MTVEAKKALNVMQSTALNFLPKEDTNNTVIRQKVVDICNLIEKGAMVLVPWPQSQEFMDEEWFLEEADLADPERFGSSAYYVPLNRIL